MSGLVQSTAVVAPNMSATHVNPTYAIPKDQAALYSSENASPSDSTSPTPSNISPTSPRLQNYLQNPPNQHRQIRDYRKPLYVPAALRPTEFGPPKHSPMTPPKSLHGSLDSLQNQGDLDQAVDHARTQPDTSLAGQWMDQQDLGDVTGPPGKEHWKPDEASPTCDSPKCRSSFNLLTRRHHCRHCGHVFCANHTSYAIPLNQDAKFHPDGVMSRACDSCHRQYQRWDSARSTKRRDSNDNEDGMESPRRVTSMGIGGGGLGGRRGNEQVASSVPRDWAWSTF